MAFKIRKTSAAERDIQRLSQWFARKEAQLGVRFLDALQAAKEHLATNASIYRVRPDGMRRIAVPGFENYAIAYRVRGDEAIVAAVFHGAQHPGRLRLREDPPS